MRSSASRLVLTIRRWGLMRWTATQPALTTPWRVGLEATGSLNTARDYHTATLLQNGMVLVAGGFDSILLPRAPNCTTRRAGPGLPRAASTPHAIITRRRCYQTAWCLLQGD